MNPDEAQRLDRLVARMLNGDVPDGLTTSEAAQWFGVTESTVRTWARRHHLQAVGRRGQQSVYLFADLVAAERLTRHSPNLRTRRPGHQPTSK